MPDILNSQLEKVNVRFKRVLPGARIPTYAHDGDSGMDLYLPKKYVVFPGEAALLDTGIIMEIPDGFEIQIRFRSSTGLRLPLVMPGGPMTVDSGYRGTLGIVVRNVSPTYKVVLDEGDRIAQAVMCRVARMELTEFDGDFPQTSRGSGGYGSTGR